MTHKNIQQLTEKKHRTETGRFLVEGEKNIAELLASDFCIKTILGTKQFLGAYAPEITSYEETSGNRVDVQEVQEEVLVRTGSLLSNNAGIAVAEQKKEATLETLIENAQKNIVILLDDVRDPGNLGTIIRTADWYGVSHIAMSPTTTDFYNPKVISASMGAFTRVQMAYTELNEILTQAHKLNVPIIVGDLEGISTHEGKLPQNGFLLMGSESHGVSKKAQSFATHLVTIPRFGKTESLNVSVATGILLDTIRRKF